MCYLCCVRNERTHTGEMEMANKITGFIGGNVVRAILNNNEYTTLLVTPKPIGLSYWDWKERCGSAVIYGDLLGSENRPFRIFGVYME